MSVIVLSGTDLCKSAINTSTAKHMYSFSKSDRFPKIKYEELPTDEEKRKIYRVSYVPDTKSTRKTSFGFGKRYDFTGGRNRSKKEPVLKTEGSDSSSRTGNFAYTPAYSFGLGRDKVYGGIFAPPRKRLQTETQTKEYPVNERKFGDDGLKFSFRGRNEVNPEVRKRIEERDKPKVEPKEPAKNEDNIYADAYSVKKHGKYYLSHIENVNAMSFGDKGGKNSRFQYNFGKVPGPGQYGEIEKNKTLPPIMGIQFNSKYRSYQPKSMYGKYKTFDSKEDNPGPGEYVLPSDFGIYKSKHAPENEKREKVKKYENYIPILREERLKREEEARERREARRAYVEDEEVDQEANNMEENNMENEGKQEENHEEQNEGTKDGNAEEQGEEKKENEGETKEEEKKGEDENKKADGEEETGKVEEKENKKEDENKIEEAENKPVEAENKQEEAENKPIEAENKQKENVNEDKNEKPIENAENNNEPKENEEKVYEDAENQEKKDENNNIPEPEERMNVQVEGNKPEDGKEQAFEDQEQ